MASLCRPLLIAVAVGAAISACGESDGSDPPERAGRGEAATTTSTTGGTNRIEPLQEPLYPRCGVAGYGRPEVTKVARFGGWQLLYTHPAATAAPGVEGLTKRFSLEERPADSLRLRYRDARTLRVRGRTVDFVRFDRGFTAQWVTERARYVAVGDGDGSIVRDLVRCTR